MTDELKRSARQIIRILQENCCYFTMASGIQIRLSVRKRQTERRQWTAREYWQTILYCRECGEIKSLPHKVTSLRPLVLLIGVIWIWKC